MVGLKDIKQRLIPRTLFGRSLLIILTPVFLLQIVVVFFFISRHWDTMTDKLVLDLSGEIGLVISQLDDARGAEQRNTIVQQSSSNLDLMISLEDSKAEVRAYLPPRQLASFSVNKKLRFALERRLSKPFVITDYGKDKWFEVIVQLDRKNIVHIAVPQRRLTSPTIYVFIIWLTGGSLILFAISVVFMRNQIRPIRRLAIAAEKLGKGQDVAHFKPEGATEIRQASKAFLEMKERLKRQIEQRTAMLAGVSHDLRTPLTRMKLQLAMTRNGPETENFRQDIEEMEKMIEGYLSFARGEGDEASAMTDLRSILDRVAAKARRQGHDVQETLTVSRMLKVRPIALERAIVNVVSNACKFAKHVWISAYEQSGSVEIVVDDDGPGIAADLREDVFRPFYRIEKSRNKRTGGIGLGLSIAQDIIHSHGGEIFLEDSNRGGLRVVMRLPV